MNPKHMAAIGLAMLAAAPVAAQTGAAQMLDFPAVETREARDAARRAAQEALVESAVLHRCTRDRSWCAELVRDGESWRLDLITSGRRIAFEPPDRDIGDPFFELWPHLVREADGSVIVGLLAARRTGFSGGGAMATRLILVRVGPGAPEAAEVLTISVQGSAIIRACFSQADYRRMGRACHQELEFSGTLTLEPSTAAGRPLLALATGARVFPRGSLTEGWEYRRPRRADLVWEDDPACSYRRSFSFDPVAGRYVADAPLPDCSQFLVGEMAVADEGPEG